MEEGTYEYGIEDQHHDNEALYEEVEIIEEGDPNNCVLQRLLLALKG